MDEICVSAGMLVDRLRRTYDGDGARHQTSTKQKGGKKEEKKSRTLTKLFGVNFGFVRADGDELRREISEDFRFDHFAGNDENLRFLHRFRFLMFVLEFGFTGGLFRRSLDQKTSEFTEGIH